MPELPEVETIRLGLQKYLVGHVIEEIEIRLPKMVSGDPSLVTGAEVTGVRRFGKGLVIDLDNQFSIAIHIKMTGQLIYVGPASNAAGAKLSEKVGGELPNSHTHVIFHLDNLSRHSGKRVHQRRTGASRIDSGQARLADALAKRARMTEEATLYYNDIRQFGWIKIVKSEKLKEISFFNELGPELFPSAGQKPLTLTQFKEIFQKAKGPIKPLLMDQKKIGGVGNIYANDALYIAKIDPKRKANLLSADEAERVFEALKQVLAKGLEVGGASEWQYVNALGQTGSYQNFFQVYGKVGKPCKRCGATIKKIVMAGRGTFFCAGCQK